MYIGCKRFKQISKVSLSYSVPFEFCENDNFLLAFGAGAVFVETVLSPVKVGLAGTADNVSTLAEKDPNALSGEVQATTAATTTG